MEYASPIITAVVDSLMVPVKKHLGFFFSSTKHVRNMSKKLSELNEAKHDMEEKKKDASIKDRPVPHSLPDWLEKVETITRETGNIPTGGNGCLNLKIRYEAGKCSFNLIKEMDDLLEKQKNIKWSEEQRPLGRVPSSTGPSTSEPVHDDDDDDGTQNMFKSRNLIFKDVLKSLKADGNTQKIALCGMGGVGKTTMMEELEKVVRKRGMFKWVLKAVVGQKTDPIAIQQAISQYMPEVLNETTRDARAARLVKIFEGMSQNGTNKILVILDDVWEKIDLEDIGLTSPLPNGFKLLITCRDEKVCKMMKIETGSIFKVGCLEKAEAKDLFWETVNRHPDENGELHNIGEGVLNKCGGLPMAIKIIASTLIGEEKDAWEDALVRLQRHGHEDLYKNMEDIFNISYNKLREEDKAIFILCGLFPDDFKIAKEELMRYGWGLQLFQETYSLIEARRRTNSCVSILIHANLLNESDTIGYVKMHDLARDFILSNIKRFKQASIVSHGDKSQWPTEDTSESCERILVKCAGMSEFPKDFYYPNLALLKLMDGNLLHEFPEDFHKRMKKLKVVAYDIMWCPLPVVSLCFSTGLRTLCLHSCSLVDISFLENLVNLEVLSLAHSGIRKLPSTIGKLKKLKLLDLTGCIDLCIDDGVFQNLDKLEELYMRVSLREGIKFTDVNRKELEMLLPKLYALEVEFFDNILQWKNVSFEKLQRFRISLGCFFEVDINDNYSLNNTLRVVTKCSDLLECKIPKLFSKTEELCFSVKDMRCAEDILMSPSQHSTFCNLKVLHVFECPDLTHLFTIPVANSLKQLESLTVSSCPVLKSLVSLCDGMNIMELPQLVELELNNLPDFTSIILNNDISTTQPLFSKEVVVPKLLKLTVDRMKKLKQIWACDITSGEEDNVSMLREIKVNDCESVVNLFPRNPMRFLRHLEELEVERCCSIDALFNIDVNEQLSMNTSSLRRIEVLELEELREVWKINDENNAHHLIRGFQAVETITINRCKKFRNVFTPTTANFDMGALVSMTIMASGENNVELVNNSPEEEITSISKMQEISKVNEHMPIVAFSSYYFNELRDIQFHSYKGVEVLFEIESSSINRELLTTQQQSPLLPCLEYLELWGLDTLSHVWKCSNWNEFFILHQHQTQSSFQNLTTIFLSDCKSMKYLFSPLMAKLLSSLKKIEIWSCEGMEEVVSNRDDGDNDDEEVLTTSTTTLFPRLDDINLWNLENLKHIGGGGVAKGKTNVVHDQLKFSQVGVVSWSLCQYSRKIRIYNCPALSSLVPSYAAGQMQKLQELQIVMCTSMVEVFETKEINDHKISDCSSNVDQGSDVALRIPRTKNITLHKLSNLKSLRIVNCEAMKVIVREEKRKTSEKVVVVFPHLKSIELEDLPNLAGFFLGMNIDFEFPSLDYVMIKDCPQMMVFTSGESTTPKLKYIHTWLGKHNVECGLNFHQISPSSAQGTPWSFHSLIEMKLEFNEKDKKIVPSNELVQLQNLEEIHVRHCDNLEEVFEEETNNESQTVVKFPKLREVELVNLESLKYIWKSNQWSILEFPNLTTLCIFYCNSLEHVFTTSMVGTLIQLQELQIENCKHMEVIVKKEEEEEEECDVKVGEIMFPSLKSLQLLRLWSLKGFCLGKDDFLFPSINTLVIEKCPQIRIFNEGRSIAPELILEEKSFGFFHRGEDINSFIMTKIPEGFNFRELESPNEDE